MSNKINLYILHGFEKIILFILHNSATHKKRKIKANKMVSLLVLPTKKIIKKIALKNQSKKERNFNEVMVNKRKTFSFLISNHVIFFFVKL